MSRKTLYLILWLSLFSIAMGFLESAVVVYLRELMYPGGFDFPLQPITDHLALTEIGREAATLIMLFTIALIAGRTSVEKFAWFIYCFAVWDIFYYIFLKVLLGWPASLMTWDILFLIPVTWTGPVIAPVIASVTMILLALILVRFTDASFTVRISRLEWLLLVSGALVMILSFTWDYSGFILEHYSFRQVWTVPKDDLFSISLKYIPRKFNWMLFILAELIIVFATGLIYRRLRITPR